MKILKFCGTVFLATVLLVLLFNDLLQRYWMRSILHNYAVNVSRARVAFAIQDSLLAKIDQLDEELRDGEKPELSVFWESSGRMDRLCTLWMNEGQCQQLDRELTRLLQEVANHVHRNGAASSP